MHEYPADPAFKTIQDIRNKKITVMGLGLNGGGEATVRFLARCGAYVTVTDMKTEAELAPTLRSLRNDSGIDQSKIRYVLGRHETEDFSGADAVIKNPGVKYEGNPYLAAARAIETDISLFLQFTKTPVIAVTGSKGKSSTVSAINYGLANSGFTSFLGGNITVSPLTFLDKTDESTPVVLELSSWQLGDLRGRNLLKPKIALITAIVPDHQNWYGNMERYVADKKLIYAGQTPDCYTVCDFDSPWGTEFAAETPGHVVWYSRKPLPDNEAHRQGAWLDAHGRGIVRVDTPAFQMQPHPVIDTLAVPGSHMRENILNASLVLALLGVAPEQIKKVMATYPGIPHRLEFFHTYTCGNTVFRFYNDSAATVPEAAAAAIQSFSGNVTAICGGTDKNLDFAPLAHAAGNADKLYVLAGSGTEKLLPLLDEKNIRYCGPFSSAAQLLSALKADIQQRCTKDSAGRTETIVFSPGATSFGMFKNEFDRGNVFKETVQSLF